MPKFTNAEKSLVKSIVATLSIKRMSDNEILQEVQRQTSKTLSRTGLYRIKQSIKRDSKEWYEALRENEYSYIHEFKERVREIEYLQKRHYQIIDDNPKNPSIIQKSLEALHTLNVTLSNYYDVAPTIVNSPVSKPNDNSISIPQKDIIV